MNNKPTYLLTTLTLLLTQLLSQPIQAQPQPQTSEQLLQNAQLLDRIAAIVNDDIILLSELNDALNQTQAELNAKGIYPQDLTALKQKVLNSLILEKLQLQKAQQLNITVTDEEIVDALNKIAQQNQLTLEQLQQQLNQQLPKGFPQFRDQLHKQLRLQKLQQRIALSQAQVTEEEIDHFLQRQQNNWRYHLGHILLALPESAHAKQRQQLEQKIADIRQKLLAGEDFSQLAIRHSQGSKALMGGDLGWLDPDQMPTFFAKQVQQLKVGQISPIIRSPVGFHLIKLLGKETKSTPQNPNTREAALNTIRLQKANEILELWLRQLQDEAYIDIKLPNLKTETHL